MAARPTYVLSVDQGTTSTRATVYDARLRALGVGQVPLKVTFPRPGWVEQKLSDIWSSVEAAIAQALKRARVKGAAIAAIGITNQRETTGVWRRDGKPLHHAIVWQDRRTAEACLALKARGEEGRVRELTGLVIDPYFSATKLAWLLEHVDGLRTRAERGDAAFGTIDSWLLFKMTGHREHSTDVANANRTLLASLTSLTWEPALTQLFAIPQSLLPTILPSAGRFGVTRAMRSLPDGIPITAMIGDQQSALFGQTCFAPGDAKCTYGTGAFLLMNVGPTPVSSQAGLLSTVAWKIGQHPTYALEGSAFVAGAAVHWLRDGLGMISRSSDVEALARRVKDSGGVVFVPAFTGLGAPHWRPEARGLITGLHRGTTQAHLARAVLDGIALQIVDLAVAMRSDAGRALSHFRVDGGAAADNLLMQIQADLLGLPVVRPRQLETTSLGAAMMAGLGAGLFASVDTIPRQSTAAKSFRPKLNDAERQRRLAAWASAVGRA